jgi:hypothetical protein
MLFGLLDQLREVTAGGFQVLTELGNGPLDIVFAELMRSLGSGSRL